MKANKAYVFTLVASAAIIFSTQALASGGSGGGGGFNRGNTGDISRVPHVRPVDKVYEIGKAIYKGRQEGEPKLSYCVVNNGEKTPVKRKSLKPYKKADFKELAKNLYNCDEPDTLIAQQLTRDSLIYVLYYLSKRHKLNLRGS